MHNQYGIIKEIMSAENQVSNKKDIYFSIIWVNKGES